MDSCEESQKTIVSKENYALVTLGIQVLEGKLKGDKFDFNLFFPKSYPFKPPIAYMISSGSLNTVNVKSF